MTKQTINVGTSPNDNRGDSLRASFQKINANFTELYTALGLDTAPLNIGAFEFTGSVLSTTDSTAITIDQATTITSNLTVGGDLLPSVANGGDLGSSARPWKSLYVSSSTIYIGTTSLGVDSQGNLLVGGQAVADVGTATWNSITGKPTFATVATSGAYSDLTGNPTIPTSFDRLVNGAHQFVLNVNGAGPWISFPESSGSHFQVQGTDIIGIGFEVQLVSAEDGVRLSANATATNGPRRDWQFGTDGILTLPQDGGIKSSTDIDITIDTPDSSTFNWRFGADGEFDTPGNINVNGGVFLPDGNRIVNAGNALALVADTGNNIEIVSDGANYVWVFGDDGNITLPNSGVIRTDGSNIEIGGMTNFNIEAGGVVNIYTDDGTYQWQFGDDGNLTFPDGSVFAGTGNIEFRNDTITDLAGMIFSNSNQTTASTAEISIPGNASGSAVLITNNSKNWAFENDGSLIVPGDIQSDSDISVRINLADSTQRVWRFGEDGDLTLPGNFVKLELDDTLYTGGLIVNVDVGYGGYISTYKFDRNGYFTSRASSVTDANGVRVGGVTGDVLGPSLNAPAGKHVSINTDGQWQWTFGVDRSFKLPYGGNIASETGINIDINLSDSTLRRWRFGEDGNLEAPGIVSAAGLRTSESKIALGNYAGTTNQGSLAVAIGNGAGSSDQGANGIAIGLAAGSSTQSTSAIAIGEEAGKINQGLYAVAIGRQAGLGFQGNFSVALGVAAGYQYQAAESVIINGANAVVNSTTSGLFINPIRNVVGTSGILQYNDSTKEISYSDTISSETDITININLSDSTLRSWHFGEDGNLTVPGGIVAEYEEDFTISTSYLGLSSPPGPVTNTLTFAANGDLTVPELILGTADLTLRAADGYTTSIEAGVGGSIEIGYQGSPPANIYIGTATTGYTTTVRIQSDRIRMSADVPTSSKGQSGDVTGQIAFSSTHIYYCTASYDGTTDIWKRVELTGGVW